MQKTANCGLNAAVSTFLGLPLQRSVSVDTSANCQLNDCYGMSNSPKNTFRLPAQMLRIMRLTCFILLACCLHVSAKTSSQSISMKGKNIFLKEVFASIEKQTGYGVLTTSGLLSNARPVTVNASDMPLNEFLKSVLKDQPLDFSIEGRTIMIIRKISPVLAPTKPLTENVSIDWIPTPINGLIRNAEGEPLSNANVIIKGKKAGISTDDKGGFTIDAEIGAILIVSSIGYQTKEVTVGEKSFLNIVLEKSVSALDDIMVIGYGTTTRRLATGSTVQVTSKEIENQPITNPLQALQGRMPGVFITQTNGLPGAAMRVEIRGRNSLTNGNLPLYIIDGVPFLSEAINSQAGTAVTGANGLSSPMNAINPADIESIDVLKDADATSIYGSRAANGVVLITTKKGKAGRTVFDTRVSSGASKVTRFLPTLTTPEYLELRKIAFKNNGITPNATNAPDLLLWDQENTTNFQKELIGNTARVTDITSSISGGDIRTNFRISGTYHKESNVFAGGQEFDRASANINIGHTSANQKLKLGVAVIFSADHNNVSITDLTGAAYSLPPNFPLYNPDGSLYWLGTLTNPLGSLNRTNKSKTTNLSSNFNLSYKVAKGLNFKTMVGFGRADLDQVQLNPISSMNPVGAQGRSTFSYNNTFNYVVEPQLNYSAPIWIGKMELLTGGTWQFRQSKQPFYINAGGFISDDFLETISAARTVSTSTASSEFKYASVFGRLNYNIYNKYIVNVNFRRDGSSRFGPGNRFGNFGSVGAAWIFSEERFMERVNWLSFAKLRGSYGLVGNDAIGDYMYFDSYRNSSYLYNNLTGLVPSRIANPSYKWEESRKLEAALELGFLEDRLSFTAAFYRNRTNNQLVTFPLSPQTGFSGYQSNLPALVENQGWEFSLSTDNLKHKDIVWRTTLNFSTNSNKLVSFPEIRKTSYYSQYVVGNPLGSSYLYKFIGFDKTTGFPIMEDLNGNGVVNTGFVATGVGDRYKAMVTYPKFFGGLGNTVTYKSITLDVFMQFVKQKGRNILTQSFYPPGYMYNASSRAFNEYLSGAGIPEMPQLTTVFNPAYTAYSNYAGSDASITDASFIRLKNVNLSYELPSNWLKRVNIQRVRFSVQAQNLFTITNYFGFDPESQGTSLPPLRTITGGFQITL